LPTLIAIIALFGPTVDGGLRLGGGLLDETPVMAFQPWLAVEGKHLRVAMGPPINVNLENGEIRERDWDEVADYGRLIHRIRWGDWLQGGVIANRSVGNGTLVRRYHNGTDRDHARLGLDMHFDTGSSALYLPNHYEFLIDQVLGAPVTALSIGRRWHTGHILLTYAADFAAPIDVRSSLDDDGWLASDRETRLAYGFSLNWVPFSLGKGFRLALLGDLNSVGALNLGAHAGIEFSYEVPKRWRINVRMMAMGLSRGYTWSLFDTGYLIDRWRGIDKELSESEDTYGAQGHIQFSIADALIIGIEYADCQQAGRIGRLDAAPCRENNSGRILEGPSSRWVWRCLERRQIHGRIFFTSQATTTAVRRVGCGS
jgi:hypothetical protein